MKRKGWRGTYKTKRDLKDILHFFKEQDEVHTRGAHLVIKSHTHTHTSKARMLVPFGE